MKLYKNPQPRDLKNLVENIWTADMTMLHYTGHMFGIGCRLSSISAIKKISRLKQRSENSGYIALIPDIEWLPENGIEIPQPLIHILNHYWPGNLTVIIPVHDERFGAISVNRKVAFRVPEDYMLRQMLEYLGEPMLSTSINISGVPPADNLNDIRKRYESWFDLGIIPNDTKLAEPSTIIEYIDSDKSGKAIHPYLKCLRESVIPFYEIKQLFSEPTILFVCTGNICRSPIAEYLFNHYGKSRKLPYTAKSAGLVESGVSISSHSLSLLKEKGINADNHVSQKINPELLGGSWLVLTMEEKQRDIIRIQYPDYAGKVYSIKEYIGEKGDIADPIGNDLDYYRNIYNQIDEALVKLFPRLTNNPDETRK